MDAENRLYDHGCDLAEAARGIAHDALDPGATRAIPGLLGCIETALEDLASVCAALRGDSERVQRGYANLTVALDDARAAAHAARALAARYAEAG
jgi:hypothetical protein